MAAGMGRNQSYRQMQSYRFYQSYRTPVLVAVSAFILVTLCFSWWRPAIASQLRDWKLLPQPERLTELYFTKPNNLPAIYTPGEPQTVQFTVHNLEYGTTAYAYKVMEQSQDGRQSQQLANGEFTLRQNHYERLSLNVVPVDLGTKVKVIVEIPTTNETISYWIGAAQ